MQEPLVRKQYDRLQVEIYPDIDTLGQAATLRADQILIEALDRESWVNIILATGNSQLSFYKYLVQNPAIDWSRVRVFQMDEYVGMKPDHRASLRRYLLEHLVNRVHPAEFYGIRGEAVDPQAECLRYAELLNQYPAHLCCLGIGENGHLAFNDPPFADFHDPAWVKIVKLDERSRLQQVGEGYFDNLEQVPAQAITVTIPALLSAQQILAIVPEQRKAEPVYRTLHGPISPDCPASILREAPHCRLFLDRESASKISDTVEHENT